MSSERAAPDFYQRKVYDGLSFIGNTEKKNVLQLLVKPGEEVTAAQLLERFTVIQEPSSRIVYGSRNNLPQTINSSHRAVGAFASSEVIRFSQWQARKAKDSRVTDAMAGHLLGIAADYELSLERLFGKTSSSGGGKRSPESRLKIMSWLAALPVSKGATLDDIAENIDSGRSVAHRHVEKLHRYGLVEYTASEIHRPLTEFRITGDITSWESSLTRRKTTRLRTQVQYAGMLTLRVAFGNALANLQSAGIDTFTYTDLFSELHDERHINLEAAYSVIGVMLREGVIERHHGSTHAKDDFSAVYTTAEQREIGGKLSMVFQGLVDGRKDTIEEGVEKGRDILSDPALVSELLRRGHAYSPNVNKVSYERRASEIAALMGGEHLTSADITARYAESGLTQDGVTTVLRRMRRDGKVSSDKHGNQQIWTLLN